MATAYGKVASAALDLPFKGRAKLVEKLLRSLDNSKEKDIEKLWAKEAEKRLSDQKAGKTKLVDGDKFLSRLKLRNK